MILLINLLHFNLFHVPNLVRYNGKAQREGDDPLDIQLTPENPLMSGKLSGLYGRWRQRVHDSIRRYGPEKLADGILLVPDLLALVIRLMTDSRVPLLYRAQLLLASVYVLSPVDIVPEVFLGAVGLADDAVVMSIVIMRLLQGAKDINASVLRELWPGHTDIVKAIHDIVDNSDDLINSKLWKIVGDFFGTPTPDPAVVERKESR